MSQERTLARGSRLGAYEILSPLGAGGMGEVYRARDPRLEREIALKVLPAALATDPERLRRFEREAKSLAALNHPGIVTVYSVEETDGLPFLTMELVKGKTLESLIPRDGFTCERFFALAVPLADALAEAHEQGIVHRDLKPGNVMVGDQGTVKVLDFGLAKRTVANGQDLTGLDTQSLTSDQTVLGTVPYLAPEQVRGGPADLRSDIFALGVVLYEMSTGRHPFRRETAADTLSSILRDTAAPLTDLRPELPGHLARIVRRCLEKDPERRYPAAKHVRNELEELQQEALAETARPGSERVSPPGARRRLQGAVVALVLGMALLAASWALRPRRDAPERPDRGPRTLAVLPFDNVSPEEDNQYFAVGITEEITSKLARLDELKVAARTSAARAAASDSDIRAIGRELGVGHLLEGSVRKEGDRVRIVAQLIDTETGFHLWSEEFEGGLDDVFAIQEETARKIAQALDLELGGEERAALERRYTENAEAFDAYLRGRALTDIAENPERVAAARRHYQRALDLDPDFAPALAGLAHAESIYYRNIEADAERLAVAEELARRALELEPDLPFAHIAMGFVLANRYDYRRASEQFREATRLDPDDALAWDILSWTLAYQQPPLAAEAEAAARRALELQPTLFGAHYHLGRALLLQERYAEALEAFDRGTEAAPESDLGVFGRSQVHLAMGAPERALAAIAEIKYGRDQPVIRILAARAHAASGDAPRALEELRGALAAGYRDFQHLESAAEFETLRADPRFKALIGEHRDRGAG